MTVLLQKGQKIDISSIKDIIEKCIVDKRIK